MVIYFDNSATTQVSEKAAAKALEVMRQNYGNPSSLYSLGLAAEKIVQDAREKAALAIGAQAEEIYFTGCGTESNNWAFKGLAEANRKGKKNHLVITAIAVSYTHLDVYKRQVYFRMAAYIAILIIYLLF